MGGHRRETIVLAIGSGGLAFLLGELPCYVVGRVVGGAVAERVALVFDENALCSTLDDMAQVKGLYVFVGVADLYGCGGSCGIEVDGYNGNCCKNEGYTCCVLFRHGEIGIVGVPVGIGQSF